MDATENSQKVPTWSAELGTNLGYGKPINENTSVHSESGDEVLSSNIEDRRESVFSKISNDTIEDCYRNKKYCTPIQSSILFKRALKEQKQYYEQKLINQEIELNHHYNNIIKHIIN